MSARIDIAISANEARALTDDVKRAAAALWTQLLELYNRGAHKALGYSSWARYCAAEFEMSDATAYRALQAARTVEQLPIGSRPASESVARELTPLRDSPQQINAVWAQITAEHGPSPTARQVHDAVAHVRTSAAEPSVIHISPADKAALTYLATLWQLILAPGRTGDDRRDLAASVEALRTALPCREELL